MEFNGTDKRYNQFSAYLKNKYGAKVYKITIDAGFSCPNRDGTISTGGCIFCDEGGSFSQAHSNILSVQEQVNVGAETLKNRFKAEKFMAYFQAYSNTYKPVNELKTINNLKNNDLAVGQLLNVPSGLSLVNSYIVEKGDTLYSIAKKFDISVNKLKEYNNLSNNLLNVGQKILIPIDEDTTYIVKSGDTLYKIAREFNTSVDDIKRLNNLKNNILSIGQILIVKEV
jgi:LysM repeat protein